MRKKKMSLVVKGNWKGANERFHQIADAINEAHETVSMSDNENDINSFENKNTERENEKSSAEESDNGQNSDKSWEESSTNI